MQTICNISRHHAGALLHSARTLHTKKQCKKYSITITWHSNPAGQSQHLDKLFISSQSSCQAAVNEPDNVRIKVVSAVHKGFFPFNVTGTIILFSTCLGPLHCATKQIRHKRPANIDDKKKVTVWRNNYCSRVQLRGSGHILVCTEHILSTQ